MRAPALALFLSATAAMADPVIFRETVTVEGREFPVPMAVEMTALNATDLTLSISGDLGALQANMPALLSQVIDDDCDGRTAVAVTEVRAEESDVRIRGQLQVRRYICFGDTRAGELLRQTADVDLVLGGEVVDGCLVMRVRDSDIRPDGLTGAILDATGLTDRLTRDLERDLDAAFAEDDNCIDVPAEFRAFGTRVTGGGFRDIGGGRLGAVIEGRMTVDAENFIGLVHLLGREGKLGD